MNSSSWTTTSTLLAREDRAKLRPGEVGVERHEVRARARAREGGLEEPAVVAAHDADAAARPEAVLVVQDGGEGAHAGVELGVA